MLSDLAVIETYTHTSTHRNVHIDTLAHSITQIYSCKYLDIVAHSITQPYIVVSIST